MKNKKIRIALTGGGSGGHIFPLFAVSEEILKKSAELQIDADLRYFGDPLDYREELRVRNIKISNITSSKIRRYFDLRNILDIFKFFISLFQAFFKIFFYMPNVCFSKGGPGSFSVVLACWFYRVPVIIHESDSIPSLNTKLAFRFAKIVEGAFESIKNYLPNPAKIKTVGNPIRKNVAEIIGQKSARDHFGFLPDVPLIFLICGSQGSEPINEFILFNLKKLLPKYQILHQVGRLNFNEYKVEYEIQSRDIIPDYKNHYKFFGFLKEDLGFAYQAADIVVARSGSGLLFEIAANKKPAILIPLASSSNNHQFENAEFYEEIGAGILLEEENLIAEVLVNEIDSILKNPEKRQKMELAAEKFYIPNSSKLIAEDIFSFIK